MARASGWVRSSPPAFSTLLNFPPSSFWDFLLLNSKMADSEKLAASAATKRPHSAVDGDENGESRSARSSASLRQTANREAV